MRRAGSESLGRRGARGATSPGGIGMAAYVAEWDLHPGGGLATWTQRYPDLVCAARPVGFRWLVRCTGPSVSRGTLDLPTPPDSTVLGGESDSSALAVFVYAPHPAETRVLRRIARADGFVLPPIVVRNGAMRVRLIAPSQESIARLAGASNGSHLISRRPLNASRLRQELESLAPVVPALTGRQTEVLLAAVNAGYYEVPRRTKVEEIARRLGLGRSTAEEHLRLAESSLIRSAAPLVALAHRASTPLSPRDTLEHFSAFSSELQLYVDLVLAGDRVSRVRLLKEPPGSRNLRPHPHLARILDHLRTGEDDLRDIPVDLQVGSFEREVLEELRKIPSGETRTYAEVARRIGHPGASRAVGNACAHNPVPLVIPCHRVVPARGGVGRYSATGGEATKRVLLEREGAFEVAPPGSIPAHGTRVKERAETHRGDVSPPMRDRVDREPA